jgi:hypothetical protein
MGKSLWSIVLAPYSDAMAQATTDEARERLRRIQSMARRLARQLGARTLDELSSCLSWAEGKYTSHALRATSMLVGPSTREGRDLEREAGVASSRGERCGVQCRTLVGLRTGTVKDDAGDLAALLRDAAQPRGGDR